MFQTLILLAGFNVFRMVGRRRNITCYITFADGNDIYGLPINPRKLIRTSFNDKELVMKWRKTLGVGEDDKLKKIMVLDKFKEYPHGGIYLNNCLFFISIPQS